MEECVIVHRPPHKSGNKMKEKKKKNKVKVKKTSNILAETIIYHVSLFHRLQYYILCQYLIVKDGRTSLKWRTFV